MQEEGWRGREARIGRGPEKGGGGYEERGSARRGREGRRKREKRRKERGIR